MASNLKAQHKGGAVTTATRSCALKHGQTREYSQPKLKMGTFVTVVPGTFYTDNIPQIEINSRNWGLFIPAVGQ